MSVGKNIPHDSARSHVSGESIFIDDKPFVKGEALCGYLGSTIACGKLISIDFKKALNVKGVLGIYTHEDLAHNRWGAIVKEQPILVDDKISHQDEPICIIAAISYEAIEEAKKLIIVEVEKQEPVIKLQESIDKKMFLSEEKKIARGDLDSAFNDAEFTLEGIYENGGQEHFYLESHATAAYPLENPMKLLKPKDIMKKYLWLMSDDSSDVHGQSIDCQ
jgi:xanthine dehydrogenase large subunit